MTVIVRGVDRQSWRSDGHADMVFRTISERGSLLIFIQARSGYNASLSARMRADISELDICRRYFWIRFRSWVAGVLCTPLLVGT